jgi:hypothetical protein
MEKTRSSPLPYPETLLSSVGAVREDVLKVAGYLDATEAGTPEEWGGKQGEVSPFLAFS